MYPIQKEKLSSDIIAKTNFHIPEKGIVSLMIEIRGESVCRTLYYVDGVNAMKYR